MLFINFKIVVGFQALVQSSFTKLLYILHSSPAPKFLVSRIKNILKEVSFLLLLFKLIDCKSLHFGVL